MYGDEADMAGRMSGLDWKPVDAYSRGIRWNSVLAWGGLQLWLTRYAGVDEIESTSILRFAWDDEMLPTLSANSASCFLDQAIVNTCTDCSSLFTHLFRSFSFSSISITSSCSSTDNSPPGRDVAYPIASFTLSLYSLVCCGLKVSWMQGAARSGVLTARTRVCLACGVRFVP